MAEILENKNERLEQSELTMPPEQREQLIAGYDRCMEEALKTGNMDMVDYYREKAASLKEAGIQEQQEYWQNKRQQREQEAAELQDRIRQDNIKRRTPNYGMPTTEEGWASKAAQEFKKNGESWYYNVCMTEAAKCHVKEALEGK